MCEIQPSKKIYKCSLGDIKNNKFLLNINDIFFLKSFSSCKYEIYVFKGHIEWNNKFDNNNTIFIFLPEMPMIGKFKLSITSIYGIDFNDYIFLKQANNNSIIFESFNKKNIDNKFYLTSKNFKRQGYIKFYLYYEIPLKTEWEQFI